MRRVVKGPHEGLAHQGLPLDGLRDRGTLPRSCSLHRGEGP